MVRISHWIYITLFFFCCATVSAEELLLDKKPDSYTITRKGLLERVWPGMTITQAIEILGKPEESLQVYNATKETASAVRYGSFWLLPPPQGGLQIQCIVQQQGFKTRGGKASQCTRISDRFKIAEQP